MTNTAAPFSPSTPQDQTEQDALEWFIRQQDGLDARQQHALQRWLARDPTHRAAYERWHADWHLLDHLSPEEYARLLPARPAAAPARAHPAPRSWYRAALAVACLVACVLGLLLWLTPAAQFQHTYITAAGNLDHFTLPDGSQIDLDSASRAEVHFYPERREFLLPEGQAMFNVQADPARPFVIHAGAARITVVGTRFAVRHTPSIAGARDTHIAVESGHVRIEARHAPAWAFWRGPEKIDLVAGQQIHIRPDGEPEAIQSIAPEAIARWRQHMISFDDIPLSQALEEFARYGHTPAILTHPAINRMRITGTFDTRQPATFYRMLTRILPLDVVPGTADQPPLLKLRS